MRAYQIWLKFSGKRSSLEILGWPFGYAPIISVHSGMPLYLALTTIKLVGHIGYDPIISTLKEWRLANLPNAPDMRRKRFERLILAF